MPSKFRVSICGRRVAPLEHAVGKNVLRSVIDLQSLSTPNPKRVDIVATEEFSSPSDTPLSPIAELIEDALALTYDSPSHKSVRENAPLRGSANRRLAEILYGSWQSRGVFSSTPVPPGCDLTNGAPILDTIPTGRGRASQKLEAALQFNLREQNKVAQPDLGADRAQLQQEPLRLRQKEAQAAAEIRDARIALNAAKQAVQTAATASLEEPLLRAEARRFRAGFSTTVAAIERLSDTS